MANYLFRIHMHRERERERERERGRQRDRQRERGVLTTDHYKKTARVLFVLCGVLWLLCAGLVSILVLYFSIAVLGPVCHYNLRKRGCLAVR